MLSDEDVALTDVIVLISSLSVVGGLFMVYSFYKSHFYLLKPVDLSQLVSVALAIANIGYGACKIFDLIQRMSVDKFDNTQTCVLLGYLEQVFTGVEFITIPLLSATMVRCIERLLPTTTPWLIFFLTIPYIVNVIRICVFIPFRVNPLSSGSCGTWVDQQEFWLILILNFVPLIMSMFSFLFYVCSTCGTGNEIEEIRPNSAASRTKATIYRRMSDFLWMHFFRCVPLISLYLSQLGKCQPDRTMTFFIDVSTSIGGIANAFCFTRQLAL
jgi:hypothetical protein